MSVYKQLSNIRKEKKSPFIVRKSKFISWTLTAASIALLIAFIFILYSALISSFDVLNIKFNQSNINNKNDVINILNKMLAPFDKVATGLGLFVAFFVSFFTVKIIVCILNMVRYYSDYKRNVVPVKSIFVFRMIFQSLMIICLALVIAFSMLGFLKLFTQVGDNLKGMVQLIKDTTDKVTGAQDAEIENIINTLNTDLNNQLNKLKDIVLFVTSKELFIYIAIGFGSQFLWVILLIIYGITIKLMLNKNSKFFGDDSLKSITNSNQKKSINLIKDKKDNKVEEEVTETHLSSKK